MCVCVCKYRVNPRAKGSTVLKGALQQRSKRYGLTRGFPELIFYRGSNTQRAALWRFATLRANPN